MVTASQTKFATGFWRIINTGMTGSNQILLQTRDLAIGYAKQRRGPLFEALELSLRKGSLTCLMGPNGSGKSTLIKTLTGLIPPLSGQIAYGGDASLLKYPRMRAKTFSVVLTGNPTMGILRVREVVAIGRHPHTKWTGIFSKKDMERVDWALEAVHAEQLADRWIHTLSDGERQRVMVARALAQDTPIIFLDEPTAYLDLPHKIELMLILRKLARDCGLTLLISTHELEMAMQHADQLWLLTESGKCECGLPEDLLLDGKLESAFTREHLSFDRSRGVFHSHTEFHSFAIIAGDNVAVKWTRNALEKLGIGVSDTSQALFHIEAEVTDMERFCYRWTIKNNESGDTFSADDIQTLLYWIRSSSNLTLHGNGSELPRDSNSV